MIPHHEKKEKGGEDAYLFSSDCSVIGVADGVGGWREYGIDPSQFPRTLMSICERLVKEGLFEPRKPKDIISKGYDEIQEYKEEITGILQMKLFSVFAL